MKIVISGKNMSLTDAIKEKVNEKLSKLNKFFTDDTTANVTIKKEHGEEIIEINIPIKGNLLRVSEGSDSLYTSIDNSIDKLERQIRKYRTKIRDKKIQTIMKAEAGSFTDEQVPDEPNEIKIVKRKQVMLKPMDDEEACMQLDMIGHAFFIYENADGKICLAYKRGDGNYGIIEPSAE